MKPSFTSRYLIGLLSLLLVFGVGSSMAQRKKPVLKKKPVATRRVVKPVEPVYSVTSGTVVRVRMNQSLTSKSARIGDTFTATVTEPVYADNGAVVIPVGSTVTGRVSEVTPAGKGGKNGTIDVSFVRVSLPNGQAHAINGSLTDLDANKTRSDNEGTATGKGMGHRKTIFIGGGAAGGAVLGGAIGGGKGALIGGILGAAAGYGGEKLTKGADAEVRSGTEFGIILNQAIRLPKFAERTTMNP